LQDAADQQEGLGQNFEFVAVEDGGGDDGVHDAGFVLHAEEDEAVGGAGPLADDDRTGNADDAAIGNGGEKRRCSFALVSKVRNYGGDLEIACNATLFDDQFEVILFEGRTTLPYLKYLAGVMTKRLAGMKGVTITNAKCLKFSAPKDQRIYVQVDGEFVGHLPAYVKVVPDALTVLLPDSYASLRGRTEAVMDVERRG
jgi:hypothetical protein